MEKGKYQDITLLGANLKGNLERKRAQSLVQLATLSTAVKQDSVSEAELNDIETRYLTAAATGDVAELLSILEEASIYLTVIDLNCKDSLDRSALSLAIVNNHKTTISILLTHEACMYLELGDSLFYAIECRNEHAVKLLLQKDPQTELMVKPGSTSAFLPGLTPFMQAAQINNYKILCILREYGHDLVHPDANDDGNSSFFSWNIVMQRVLYYRAKVSPAYMLLMYNEFGLKYDPLIRSMEVFQELKYMASEDEEVAEQYDEMALEVENFAMDLLNGVRSATELAALMKTKINEDSYSQEYSECLMPIEKAVHVGMMNFTTSDNAQLALIYTYKGKLFRNMKGWRKKLLPMMLGCLFPFLCLFQLFIPKTYLGKLLDNNMLKFWCHAISEIYYVGLLLASIIISETNGQKSVPPFLAVAYCWVVGKFIEEIRQLLKIGYRKYLRSIWNWNDMAVVVSFTIFMFIRILYKPISHDRFDGVPIAGNSTFFYEELFNSLMLSDFCLAAVYMFSFLRLMEILRVSRYFGPLQLSLQNMVLEISKFVVVFIIVFFAFVTCIHQIFAPYNDRCSCNPPTNNKTVNTVEVVQVTTEPFLMVSNKNLASTLKITLELFWTMFGYGEPRSIFQNNCNSKAVPNIIGHIVMGIYHLVAVILLINMMIAILSDVFTTTNSGAQIIWKFHRAELWLKYIRNEFSRPPPMNIIPNLYNFKCCLKKTLFKTKSFVTSIEIVPAVDGERRTSVFPMVYLRKKSKRKVSKSLKTKGKFWIARETDFLPSDSVEVLYAKVLHLVISRYMKSTVLFREMVPPTVDTCEHEH